MRDGWVETTLGSVCDLTKGATPTQKARPGPYPLVVTAENRASCDKYQFDTEAVCVPMVSSTGHGHASLKRVHYQAGKFAVANIITACTAKPGAAVDMKYLWLLLDHFRDQLIVPLMKGTANVSLSQRSLALVPVPLPPLFEQRRIVDLVGALDEVIAAAHKSERALSATLAARRNVAFSRSETRSAHEMFEITIGLQRSPARAQGPHQTRYLRSANVTSGRLVLDDVKSMSFEPAQQAKYRLMPGDVLVSEGSASEDAVGAPAQYRGELPDPLGFQNTLLRYRAVPGVTTPEFTSQWCAWAYESGAFRKAASGTNIKHIGSGGALIMRVADVPFEEQPDLTAGLHAAQAAVEAGARSVARLRNLRSNLLTALLSGEHVIPESYDELMGDAS